MDLINKNSSITELYYLLGCDTMSSGRSLPTFQRNILIPSSGSKISKEGAVQSLKM
jgi:hypothetical protein